MTREHSFIDVWRDRVYTIAVDRVHEIRNAVASGHSERCILCDTPNVTVEPADITGFVETYTHSERDRGVVARAGIIVSAQLGTITFWKQFYSEFGQTTRTPLLDPLELTLESFERFDVPEVVKELKTNIHQHHIQYKPEITISLCATCHRKVHRTDGWHDGLQPEIDRSMWEP